MPAYSRPLPKPKCDACKRSAQVEVFNRVNLSVGYYCRRCGARKVKDLNHRQEGEW